MRTLLVDSLRLMLRFDHKDARTYAAVRILFPITGVVFTSVNVLYLSFP